jgi:predicted Rossmann fold nucleotide-binding protein DprA/Smf involved in DNA uptake
MGLKVSVVGGRDFNDYWYLKATLDLIKSTEGIDMIISGGAKGADELAYRYAVNNGITFVCHPPKPEDGYPRACLFGRNLRIVETGEILIAFPTKNSKGTYHSINLAKRLKRRVGVFPNGSILEE